MTARAALAIMAAAVLLAGATELTRAGYSRDEEFTVFAVNGIEADGLPILPSGLLYDRGVAYSYASWLTPAVIGSPAARLAAARPTIHAPGIDEIRNQLQPTDRIACTDELGCLMLVNRIDVWLALDDYVRDRFLVRKGDEMVVGVYTGAPAVLGPAELFSPGRDGALPERTLIVDIFKDYPIGNSRTWLPRAIEADGLQVRPLLETPQLRVLQVSPPVSNAGR